MAQTNDDRIVVTSALPYANGPIHIGHLVEYIQSDIITRFYKLQGKDAVHLCAADTHGTPIQVNAQEENMEPEEFVNKWYDKQLDSFKLFNIEFDSYHSTDSEENKYFVETFYKRLQEKDMIYQEEIEQAYCEEDERFLPDRYVKGTCPECGAENQYGDQCESCGSTYEPTDLENAECQLCGNEPVTKTSEHYFFKLSEMEDELEEWISNNDNLQDEIKNQILNWIDDGLDDWCISRDKPYHGFEIPDSDDKYFYVWLDAPMGYISSLANYLDGDVEKAEEYWNDSEIIHFIGKDIIYFHLLFWPAVLMKTDMNLPSNVFAHGFLNLKGEKMSKSRGTFLTAEEWAEIADPELLRFYYAASLTDKVVDINLDVDNFQERVNNELVSNIANLVYRTLSFVNKYFEKEIGDDIDEDFIGILKRRINDVIDHYEEYNLRKAMDMILHISQEGNKYFQDKRPWVTARTNKTECRRTLTTCVNLVKNLIILLKPVMPEYAEEIEKQLNLEGLTMDDLGFDLTNHEIGEADIVYEKIQEIEVEAEESIFEKLNLRVAEVLDVRDHPNADNLYLLDIDLGDEERQIVAGLKDHYQTSELEGKKIVVVANMEEAEIRGEKSEAMMLAAEGVDEEGEDAVGILFVQSTPNGDPIKISGVGRSDEKISFDEFQEVDITTKEGRVYHDDEMLRTNSEYVKVERVEEGSVK